MRPAKRRFASNPVVPKLCLGMRPREALLRLAVSPPDSGFIPQIEILQAELGKTHSQAELGNDNEPAPLLSFQNFHSARP